jgi:hypothetical protein
MARAKKSSSKLLARSITLVDDAGKMRALLGTGDDGNVFLNLYGSDRACLTACIDGDGNPKLCFQNKKGNVVMSLGVSDDMGQGIQVADSEGRPVCFIFTPADGIPRIQLFQTTSPATGKKLWASPLPKKKRRT